MDAGYREIAHTADWELEAWAADLTHLLEQAARGMYALAGARLAAGPRQARRIEIQAADPEGLLVDFLSELLWLGESAGLAFDAFNLHIEERPADGLRLQAYLDGAPLAGIDKEIKAITWHGLAIRPTPGGLAVNVVLDV